MAGLRAELEFLGFVAGLIVGMVAAGFGSVFAVHALTNNAHLTALETAEGAVLFLGACAVFAFLCGTQYSYMKAPRVYVAVPPKPPRPEPRYAPALLSVIGLLCVVFSTAYTVVLEYEHGNPDILTVVASSLNLVVFGVVARRDVLRMYRGKAS
jgi:hypothetical protein